MSPDLTQGPPRSPHAMLVRATRDGRQGTYKISPGLSALLLESPGIEQAAFIEAVVRRAASDDEVVSWLRTHSDASTYPAINERLSTRAIRDEQHRAEILPRHPWLADHPEMRAFFEILERDDAIAFDDGEAGRPGGGGGRPAPANVDERAPT